MPDLIVLDLMMPVMDGAAFIETCRQLPDCHHVSIIVISAAGMGGRYARLEVDFFSAGMLTQNTASAEIY